MNGYWRHAFMYALMAATLLLTTSHLAAAPASPQVLHAFCDPSNHCTDEQAVLGHGAQNITAGPDGAYYGTTYFSNTIVDQHGYSEAGGSVYRVDPVTRTIRALYQFPWGYYPAPWLKVGADGNLYGGYTRTDPVDSRKYDGFFRLSPEGEFKVIHEARYAGIACNGPVQDILGNWIGLTNHFPSRLPAAIYKLSPSGAFKVLHTLAADQSFSCPNEPALAADGNLYGVILGSRGGSPSAIFRLAPDEVFTILHQFDATNEGTPATPVTIGPDGALYGVLFPHHGGQMDSMYRLSLDGQFTDLGTFGSKDWSIIDEKLILMPDGYFYGTGFDSYQADNVIFRLSPAGAYTELYVFPSIDESMVISPLIRGFDNALYGTSLYGGNYGGGVLFRYMPPPAQ